MPFRSPQRSRWTHSPSEESDFGSEAGPNQPNHAPPLRPMNMRRQSRPGSVLRYCERVSSRPNQATASRQVSLERARLQAIPGVRERQSGGRKHSRMASVFSSSAEDEVRHRVRMAPRRRRGHPDQRRPRDERRAQQNGSFRRNSANGATPTHADHWRASTSSPYHESQRPARPISCATGGAHILPHRLRDPNLHPQPRSDPPPTSLRSDDDGRRASSAPRKAEREQCSMRIARASTAQASPSLYRKKHQLRNSNGGGGPVHQYHACVGYRQYGPDRPL